MNNLDENTEDLLTKLWTAKSLGAGREQDSELGRQKKQDPKWIKLVSTVLLALTFYEPVSWNEEWKLYDETQPTTQV